MATLNKDRARKPLAIGKLNLSYGMRYGVNEGKDGIAFRLNTETGGYSLHVTNAELDSAVLTRQMFAPQHDLKFSDAALDLAKSERDKDARHSLDGFEQTAKALEMAYNLLRTFMPGTEQDRNGTLAYIASIAKY